MLVPSSAKKPRAQKSNAGNAPSAEARLLSPLDRLDRDLRGQRAMHRALIGDLQQAPALLLVERPAQDDRALDAIDHAFLGLAIRAIGGMNLVVLELVRRPLERQALALGIEPQGHR